MGVTSSFDDPEVAAAYAKWRARDLAWLLGYPFLFRALEPASDGGARGPVLDVGCGHGEVAVEVARRFASQVVAVDASPAMLEVARREHADPSVTYHQAEGRRLDFLETASMAAAYSAFVLLMQPSRAAIQALADEVGRVLRPGARFAVLDIDHSRSTVLARRPATEGEQITVQVGDTEIHDYYWLPETYTEILERAGFADVEVEWLTWEGIADPVLFSWRDRAPGPATCSLVVLSGTRR
jgi:ubiquinone/menaquinone biosynthesis C-methylase UbiE